MQGNLIGPRLGLDIQIDHGHDAEEPLNQASIGGAVINVCNCTLQCHFDKNISGSLVRHTAPRVRP